MNLKELKQLTDMNQIHEQIRLLNEEEAQLDSKLDLLLQQDTSQLLTHLSLTK